MLDLGVVNRGSSGCRVLGSFYVTATRSDAQHAFGGPCFVWLPLSGLRHDKVWEWEGPR